MLQRCFRRTLLKKRLKDFNNQENSDNEALQMKRLMPKKIESQKLFIKKFTKATNKVQTPSIKIINMTSKESKKLGNFSKGVSNLDN